jgi:hypothetical protein
MEEIKIGWYFDIMKEVIEKHKEKRTKERSKK